MGLPPRSCATDAHHCIMVEVCGPAEYKCVARVRVHRGELPSDRESGLTEPAPYKPAPAQAGDLVALGAALGPSRSSALIRACFALVGPAAGHDHVRPAAPSRAASPPCTRSSPRSSRSLPIARHDRPRAPAPSAPPVRGLQAHTGPDDFCFSSLHPLKDRSLRKTRRGSLTHYQNCRCTPLGAS